MTILVTGARGVVGSYFSRHASLFAEPLELIDREELDITNLDDVRRWFERARYSAVINLAAATDLDQCEKEPGFAFAVNTAGAWNLALAAQQHHFDVLQVSTVGIFGADGAGGPFSEVDTPAPVNVYAKTKLAGERYVQSLWPRSTVVRTAWVFGGGKTDKKFVGKLRDRIRQGEPVRAVDDKIGSPTYANDLVVGIARLLARRAFGLYHVTNRGAATRYDMACELKTLLGSSSTISRARSEEFPLPAARPPSEVSVSYALEARGLGDLMPTWQDALRRYLEE